MKTILSTVLSVMLWAVPTGFVFGQSGGETPTGPGLHARLFDAHLQPVLEVCAGKDQPVVCINRLWDVADVSGDGELSVAEVMRILRIASGKVAYQSYVEDFQNFQINQTKGGPPEPNEAAVVVGVATAGPLFIHALLANFDYDDNGHLSKAEALNDLAADIVMSSVEELPPEIQSHASKAFGFLMQFLMKQ